MIVQTACLLQLGWLLLGFAHSVWLVSSKMPHIYTQISQEGLIPGHYYDDWEMRGHLQPPTANLAAYVWVAINPFTLMLGLKSGVFWNALIISFPMSTETLWLSPKMTEKIGFRECWGQKSLSGRPEFWKQSRQLQILFSPSFLVIITKFWCSLES